MHGTVLGVMIMGLIRTWISFHGSMNSWLTRVAIGLLVLTIIALQHGLSLRFSAQERSIS